VSFSVFKHRPAAAPSGFDSPRAGSGGAHQTVDKDLAKRRELVSRLFREHNEGLIGFLIARGHSSQEAMDIAQEAYVKLLQLDESKAISFLRTYLFEIAKNLGIDRHRARRAEGDRLLRLKFFDEPDSVPDPQRDILASERLKILKRSLDELSPTQRVVFYLHRLDGRTTSAKTQRSIVSTPASRT